MKKWDCIITCGLYFNTYNFNNDGYFYVFYHSRDDVKESLDHAASLCQQLDNLNIPHDHQVARQYILRVKDIQRKIESSSSRFETRSPPLDIQEQAALLMRLQSFAESDIHYETEYLLTCPSVNLCNLVLILEQSNFNTN